MFLCTKHAVDPSSGVKASSNKTQMRSSGKIQLTPHSTAISKLRHHCDGGYPHDGLWFTLPSHLSDLKQRNKISSRTWNSMSFQTMTPQRLLLCLVNATSEQRQLTAPPSNDHRLFGAISGQTQLCAPCCRYLPAPAGVWKVNRKSKAGGASEPNCRLFILARYEQIRRYCKSTFFHPMDNA